LKIQADVIRNKEHVCPESSMLIQTVYILKRRRKKNGEKIALVKKKKKLGTDVKATRLLVE